MSRSDFQFAILTPAGRGAVAVIAVRGEAWHAQQSNPDFPFVSSIAGRLLSEQPLDRIWYGLWRTEEVVICRTETNRWEITCHGGQAAVASIRNDLIGLGGSEFQRPQFTSNRTVSHFEREYETALQQAPTWKTAERLLQHPTACVVATIRSWIDRLADPSTAKFDFDAALARVKDWLSQAEFGVHLASPWNVMLVGEPNVGKSSLLNRIAGYERAIVHHEPGTTRDLVAVECAIEGWPVRLIDSAGIREGADPLEALGIERAMAASRSTDLILHLYDVSRPPSVEELQLRGRWPDAVRVAHKADLPRAAERAGDPPAIAVSSHSGMGVDELMQAIVGRLIPTVPNAEAEFPVTVRQVELLERLKCELEDGAGPQVHITLDSLLA